MRKRRRGASAVAGLAVLVLAGCTAPQSAETPPVDDAEVRAVLEQLPVTSSPTAPSERLDPALVPPTNRWFSGLVFGDAPQPVFPSPISFALTSSGFSFGLPAVTSAPGLITGAATAGLTLDAGTQQVVTRYDDVSVTLTGSRSGEAVGETTIARGSPTVSYAAVADHDLALSAPLVERGDGAYSTQIGGVEFGVVSADATLADGGATLQFPAGAAAVFVAAPPGGSVTELAESVAPITGVEVEYAAGDDEATTRLSYTTANGEPTLVGILPHQLAGYVGDECEGPSYLTVGGTMALCATRALEWTVPALDPADSLDLGELDDAERAEVLAAARTDVAELTFPTDTYFGGKALGRVATLLQLARGLGDAQLASELQDTLATELRRWTDVSGCDRRADQCFTYDDVLRGVVGQAPSFGSEQFNDHHFHYGYFLYAAAIAVAEDDQLLDDIRPVMTALAADVSSEPGGELLPGTRNFDAYMGHSYASGFSPFADGNNQESSSESVSAWNGLALWAAAAADDALLERARWMLSAEAASALSYWVGFDQDTAPYADFERSVVGIVWDGKRDYLTWFSPEPSAIVGIQLVPMAPVAGYLAGDPERILKNIDQAGEPGQFADYLAMYRALAGPDEAAEALEEARALGDERIDDGNSRAYLLAWVMSRD
jgi:endoglucanase Acf2